MGFQKIPACQNCLKEPGMYLLSSVGTEHHLILAKHEGLTKLLELLDLVGGGTMKLFRDDHVFKNDWTTVVSAFWLKYPNPLQPHVTRIDTIDRCIDKENRRYRALRLMSLHYSIPSWIQSLISRSPTGYGLEETVCDINTKTLTLKTTNLTFSRVFQVEETCEYRPHPDNPEHWTLYTQKAVYKINGLGYLSQALEKAVIQSAGEKAKKGLEAMQSVIHRLEETDWKQTCSQKISTLEQRWIERKGKVEKTVFDAKQRMEETVLRQQQGNQSVVNVGTEHESKDDEQDHVATENSRHPNGCSLTVAESNARCEKVEQLFTWWWRT